MADDGDMFEKMVEMGMGMAVMGQIPHMMNSMMPGNAPAASVPPPIKGNETAVYIAINGKPAGPFSTEELRQLIGNKVVTEDTLVWMAGMPQWTNAKLVPLLNKIFIMQQPAQASSKLNVANANAALREEILSAMARLGYADASVRKIVDEIISDNPNVSTSDAVKEILKRM